MANILPIKVQRSIQKEYRLRFFSLASFLLALVIFAAFLLFIPVYILTRSQEQAALGQIALLEELAQERSNDERSALVAETRAQLDALFVSDEEYSLTALLSAVIEEAPASISITRFSFEDAGVSESYTDGRLVVSGTADTRTSLISFTKSLRTLDEFSEVILPVSQLAQENEIAFSVTLPLKPPQQ